jgi:hypothetical protein
MWPQMHTQSLTPLWSPMLSTLMTYYMDGTRAGTLFSLLVMSAPGYIHSLRYDWTAL